MGILNIGDKVQAYGNLFTIKKISKRKLIDVNSEIIVNLVSYEENGSEFSKTSMSVEIGLLYTHLVNN